MSINNVNNSGLPSQPAVDSARGQAQQTQNQANTQSTASQTAQAVQVPRQDSVTLTQSAQQLNQAQRRGGEAPVNQERVERLREAVQNGEYRVNPESLAARIVQLESQIFNDE